MLLIVGAVIVMGMVFGGYILAGGKIGIIIKALPFEMMMIGGAATGAFVISNDKTVIKAALKDFGRSAKGSKWKRQDYTDLLCLLFQLVKLIKTKGMIAIEPHIEKPDESTIFNQYDKIAHDHFALDFICDTLRTISMNMEDPHQVEDMMEKQLEKHHHEHAASADAINNIADGLPALGIVAAVLGVIKTMASIDQPPPILGKMIGGALVGTFLGVFLAYGFVGPIAKKVAQVNDEEAQFYFIIRDVLVANLHGSSPQVAIEVGRGNVPTHMQPTFAEIEDAVNNLPAAA
jgi:chemotaxis protein MotA